jgi:hypothetical protein
MAVDSSSIPPLLQRVLIYASVILVAVAAAVGGVRWFGFLGEETLLLEGAILFLVAGSGRAPRLFAAVRQAGEFRGVTNDRVMRSILIVLAALIMIAVIVRRVLFPTT